MFKRLAPFLAVLGLIWAYPNSGYAQVFGGGIAVQGGSDGSVRISNDYLGADVFTSIQIESALSIDVDMNSLSFPTPTADDFYARHIDGSHTIMVNHMANVAHDILVNAEQAHFSNAFGTPTTKPVTDLLWRANIDDAMVVDWTDLETSTVPIETNVPAGTYQNRTEMRFRIKLDPAENLPDDYRAAIIVSIIAS